MALGLGTHIEYFTTQRNYWYIKNSSAYDGNICVNSDGYLYYAFGYLPNVEIFKINPNGESIWTSKYTKVASTSNSVYDIKVKSNGDVYFLTNASDSTTPYYRNHIVKMDNSGNILWQTQIYGLTYFSGNKEVELYSLDTDSAGNVYVTGVSHIENPTYWNLILVKLNSSGVVQWKKELGTTTSYEMGSNIKIDSSDNIYVYGFYGISTTIGYVVKFNTDGIVQWQKTPNIGSGSVISSEIGIDSSGNIYVPDYSAAVVKLSAAGSVVWNKTIKGSIAVDADGNVYYCYKTSTSQIEFGRYNLVSGTAWHRKMIFSSSTNTPEFQTVWRTEYRPNGELYFKFSKKYTLPAGGVYYEDYILKYPSDGSITGTYGDFTISSLTQPTLTTTTPTPTTTTLPTITSQAQDATGFFTETSNSRSFTVVQVGT